MRSWAVPMMLLGLVAWPAWALPSGFAVEEVVHDEAAPVFFDFAPDGRIFFNEYLTGRVRVVNADGALVEEPFAEFDDVEVFFERGFLGLELDPDFEDNHLLYIYYSSTDGTHKLVRIREEGGVAAEIVYLRDDLPLMGQGNHNGGPIVFGPDRSLYLSIGELSVETNSQDLEIEAGKILRMDRDGLPLDDNPFGGDSTVWAYGIRNTFGLSFNPLTGGLYGSENGPTYGDEINRMIAGGNYGWPAWTGAPGIEGFEDAIFSWSEAGICPTGIVIYCGSAYPEEYLNDVFVGTCDPGRIRHFEMNDEGTDVFDEDPIWYVQPSDGLSFDQAYMGVLDLDIGPDGLLWFSTAMGIYKVTYAGAPAGPANVDCDLFDGEFPGVGGWDDDDDDTVGDDDTTGQPPGGDDDSSDVAYKKCVCRVTGEGAPAQAMGLAMIVGWLAVRRANCTGRQSAR